MAEANNNYNDAEAEKARSDANNAQNVRNAADVAIATKNPYAVAAGAAVKGADKLTGGKASEAIGKGMTNANKLLPGGNHFQNMSNRLNESGVGDKVGRAASVKNQMAGSGSNGGSKANEDTKTNEDSNLVNKNKSNVNNGSGSGGGQNGSLPSSSGKAGSSVGSQDSQSDEQRNDSSRDSNANTKSTSMFRGMSPAVKIAVISIAPFIVIVIMIIAIVASVTGSLNDYDDAVGISETMGEETGGVSASSTTEQKEYYERINNVKLRYQASGKSVDALKIVAVFHIMNNNGASLSYDDITESDISFVADAMFDGNTYSEDTFKENLINTVFPKYLSDTSQSKRESMADDVFEYIDNYYNLIGKELDSSTCGSTGSCSYEIKGYYISGKGNVTESIQASNLYVRLMQCGTANGHNYGGTFGEPLEGEELVSFEKYILGVAYQEIGPDAPAEAIKAQMVAARSYILARHADMGGWRTLKQESDGKWVLQVASCTQDQVYCDPDQGCSGSDGQWGQIYSGLGHGSFQRSAMASDSPLRTYANETAGEVLINSQGYIIYSGYTQTEQNKFISLAKSGLNYKQILLQVYNQGSRNYGATSIQKNSCGSSNCGAASGDYKNWKQYEGSWINVQVGTSGKTIKQIGCLATAVSIQIARSGVQTNISDFNPGTFVEYLNSHGGFASGGNFNWPAASYAAPSFQFVGKVDVSGWSREQKLSKIKELVNQENVYVVAEVKGNTGQHWVAIDYVDGSTVYMMDPGSSATEMWTQYNWANTSTLAYFKVTS